MKRKYLENKLSLVIVSLLFMVMLTSTLAGNLLAKFTTGTEDEETAQVAKFKITETGVMEIDVTTEKIRPGKVIIQPITVQNESEVAVKYTLTASTTGNLPLILKMNEQEGSPLVFSQKLTPNDKSVREYNLQIIWPENENDPQYIKMIDVVKLSLSVVQVD